MKVQQPQRQLQVCMTGIEQKMTCNSHNSYKMVFVADNLYIYIDEMNNLE